MLTFVKQGPTFEMILEHMGWKTLGKEASGALHIFDVEGLDNYVSQTGFKGFMYNTYEPYILFNAEKK